MSSKVLVTGGSGLLGLNWAASLRQTQKVILAVHQRPVSMSGVQAVQVSLESVDSILRTLDSEEPDLVVHAAGLTSIEACEANPELAHHVNVQLADNVARACAARRVKLVHISTDHLFSGEGSLLTEKATVAPVNVYGQTKAEAESRVLESLPSALVIRTNFYGWGPSYRQSFSDWILSSLKVGKPITLFDDVFYTPILASRVVYAVHALLDRAADGVFHVVGDNRISKHEFGMRIASRFGFDHSLIKAGSIGALNSLVCRPRDMSLSNQKVTISIGEPIGGVAEHLDMLYQQRNIAHEFSTL